jgi:hypothetical protein
MKMMSILLNSYSHGYVAAAVIDTCRRLKIFTILNTEWMTLSELAEKTSTNTGYLHIALHLLQCMEWVECTLNEHGQKSYHLTPAADLHTVPEGISALYKLSPQTLLDNIEHQRVLTEWLVRLPVPSDPPPAVALIAGPVMVPLLHLFCLVNQRPQDSNQPESFVNPLATILARIPAGLRKAVADALLLLGWAAWEQGDKKEENTPTLGFTERGRHAMESSSAIDTVLSYRPMLEQMEVLLTGNKLPNSIAKVDSHERRKIDRTIHLQASKFQHHEYFQAVKQIVMRFFNTTYFPHRPQYIAHTGCGDGSFLRELYDAIRGEHTRRKIGSLTLIGIVQNERLLQAAEKNLGDRPHCLVIGDINDPGSLLNDLKMKGIATDRVLHIHTFFDNSFTVDQFIKNRDLHAIAESPNAFALRPSSVYIDSLGSILEPYDLVRHWRAHLERWASILNENGLIVVEAHCLNTEWIRRTLSENDHLYFDHLHAFAGHYLIDAELFLLLAANVGLFADSLPQYYPHALTCSDAMLSHLHRREYRVRYAHHEDLATLWRLEERCWAPNLRTPIAELRRRISEHPQGQFVLEWQNKVVGVIYSQRIASINSIAGLTSKTIGQAHQEDGALVQLLALNIMPSQSQQLGDALLEFMLQRCSVIRGVEGVITNTLCKGFQQSSEDEQKNTKDGAEIQAYIQLSNEQGHAIDPALHFHQRHGARIGDVAHNYWTQDMRHFKHGVWVYYDLKKRG